MSVHWPIIRQLLSSPRREVIVDDRRAFRAIEILIGALHIAEEVSRRSKSRTLGVLLPTSGVFPMALLAGWMLGRTVVPLNYLLKPDELAFVIDDCETDCVVTVEPMLEFLRSSHKEEAAATPTALAKVAQNLVRLDAMDFSGAPALRWPAHAHADDLALLLYTSGTSGRPKGVMLSHGNIGANIAQIREWVRFTRDDVLAGVLPQFHTFGLTALTLLPLTAGCKVVYTARFVPAKIVQLIRQHRATALIAIPSMYNALLQVKNATAEDFASLRYTVSGGEPLPAAVFDGFRERFGVTLNEGYGLTETAPVTNWCRPHEWRRHSVGRALPRVIERIVDPETGRDLPPGRDGEVRIKGPNVMRGYFKRPEETAAAFDDHGFLRTGDIGRLDEDGHLYITGRLKEMLIVGGENVFPREIEEVLNRHPGIKESGVVGVMDDIRGEVPVAYVELREGAAFDERDVQRHCREHLAGYKVPRHVRVLEALPRNPTGKVMRRELKKLAAEGN
ncbi:MAG: AMP-binding protein [Phycisphaeraceae bacterium]|nr:AMP-binding protein [Phycisphaeraceae bacterium]